MAASWIHADKISIEGEDLKCNLTGDQKIAIITKYTASRSFSDNQKKDLKLRLGSKVPPVCNLNIPDETLKA